MLFTLIDQLLLQRLLILHARQLLPQLVQLLLLFLKLCCLGVERRVDKEKMLSTVHFTHNLNQYLLLLTTKPFLCQV